MQPPVPVSPAGAGSRRLPGTLPPYGAPVAQLLALAFLTATLLALLVFTLYSGGASPLPFVWGTFGGDSPADYRTTIGTVAPIRANIQPAP